MAEPLANPNPKLFLGPMLIGVFLNLILYGVLIVQAYRYFQLYKLGDKWWILVIVVYLLVLETLNSAFLMTMMYDTLINKILGATGPPKGPPGPPIFLSADPILTALISTPVQFYLTWRVHKFSGVSVVIVFICMLSLTSLGAAIAMTTLVTMFPAFTEFGRFIPAAATWLISSAVADVLITGSLIATLSRRRTGMAITDSMINKIIIFTIETGLITAAFAVADAILFLSLPDAAFNFIPDFALSKLYTNTLLASLNVRSQRSSDMNRSEVILHVSGVGRDGVPHTTRGGDFAMSVSNPTSTRTSSLHFAAGHPKGEQGGPWGGRRSSDSLDEESERGHQ